MANPAARHEEGESVVHVDDGTDSVHDGHPDKLVEKLQREVNNTVSWLKDNRLCVAGDKSKLLVIGHPELRKARLTGKLAIVVDGQRIEETESEKLLGVGCTESVVTATNHMLGWLDVLNL